MHVSYAEETVPSLNVNDTDEDKSKEIRLQNTLSNNQSKEKRKSECNIVHKNLSQNNSSDVPTNIITKLKDYEHKEPSVTEKVASNFNIFKCGRKILDQLDVTYQ